MAEIPHFALPFRVDQGTIVTVEQDSGDDIGQCVGVIASTGVGALTDFPTFGIPRPEFSSPVSPQEILDGILLWEPRATVDLEDVSEIGDLEQGEFAAVLRGLVTTQVFDDN